MRRASRADVEQLVALMSDFYAESGYRLDSGRATEAFELLLTNERLGRIWLIQAEQEDVGYLVVTLGFSMEYGGVDGFVDDLYVRPEHRGKGLGTRALDEVKAFCVEAGVRALHLEVGHDNAVAQGLYRKAGFEATGRQLLTLRLAARL
jgi:ribosomal protein S18 acetylase RimI-like enzyme